MGTQAPITAPVDPYEEAMKRKRLQEQMAGGQANVPNTAPSPAPSPTPTPQPQVSPLDTGKLKLSMGMPESSLTPEEQAALAAEQIAPQAPPPQAAQPGPAEPGFLQRMMSAIGLGG